MRGSRIGRWTAGLRALGLRALGLAAIGLAGCTSGTTPVDGAVHGSADPAAAAGPRAARDFDRSGRGSRPGRDGPMGGIGASAGDGTGAGDPGGRRGHGWPVAADCPSTLRALAVAAARGALPRESAGAPLALLEPPGAAGAATLLLDVALPRLEAARPDAPPCLLELAVEPVPAERRVVGRETIWSERAGTTERRVNPEHEAARRELARLAERLERENRAQAKDVSRLTMTGNPLVDAAGLLGGLVLGGIGSLARDRELAEAEARVAAIPRLIEETRFEPYELAVEATDLVRRARVRAALVGRDGGRRTVELPVERTDRLLVAPRLHPRDRSRLERDGRLVAPADLEALAASPPPVPVSALLGPLAAALAGPDPAAPPDAPVPAEAPLAGRTGAGLTASPIGTAAAAESTELAGRSRGTGTGVARPDARAAAGAGPSRSAGPGPPASPGTTPPRRLSQPVAPEVAELVGVVGSKDGRAPSAGTTARGGPSGNARSGRPADAGSVAPGRLSGSVAPEAPELAGLVGLAGDAASSGDTASGGGRPGSARPGPPASQRPRPPVQPAGPGTADRVAGATSGTPATVAPLRLSGRPAPDRGAGGERARVAAVEPAGPIGAGVVGARGAGGSTPDSRAGGKPAPPAGPGRPADAVVGPPDGRAPAGVAGADSPGRAGAAGTVAGAACGPGGAGPGWAAGVPQADGVRRSQVGAGGPGGSAEPGSAGGPADGRWRVGTALGAQSAAGPAADPAGPAVPHAALVTVEGQGGRAHGFYLDRRSILTLGRVLGGSSLARVTTADGFETWGVVAHAPPGELVLLHVERAGRALPLAAAGSPLPTGPLPAAGRPLLADGVVAGVSLDPLAGRAADAAELARLLAGLKGR